ncbi:putative phage tail protein [Sulfuritortus calidifontis]|uniref:Putative phage tail protein n=1 Tax=Sulfuritortus calidifontis TaxID=1914471 RepID=A0A4R3JY48_9PROT|nr:phage tail protein [Sulfuritortus calidifontis]TCS72090.1 putative phage tail protein [Sulfuritortus calidifontis]
MNDLIVRGAGGGGGGKGGGGGSSHVPTEAPNTLRSRAYARVIDVLSEGEIEGLVDGLKSIYLDNTPIQNADGTLNFSGVSVAWRNGLPTQAYVPGFAAVENEIAVATEVKAAAPVVRAITNPNLSAVRVTVSVPQLSYQNQSTGDLSGTSVEIAIDIDNNGGGWQEVKRDTISGKTMSRYQRSYRIDLPAPGPWQVRVRRITADATQANVQNKTFWDSTTEIIDAKLRYPHSALVAIQIDSAQFNRIPRRGYDIRGLRVRVPVNYDPIARSYSGVWDGSFKIAWTDNPAWCFYDLLTNERYGLGQYLDASQIDKWALYEIARYCDELVPDGFGGMEPRFTCNLYLQTRQEAYTVIQQMAAIFRGMAWWANGTLTCSQDAPADPVALFNAANVVDGMFTYSGSSARQRHTVALVTWNDPADMYRQKIEYVEDEEGIARFGVRETEIVAVGCTSRGQAHRVGRWLLYTERSETETVTFRAGLEGALVWPGAVIAVQDAARAGVRFGGRVLDATTTAVTLDAPVTIEYGKSHTLSVMLTDGVVASRAVTNAPGQASVLALDSALPAAPVAGAVWVLAASDLAPTLWRVVALREVDWHQVEVTALAHQPGKYDAIERDIVLDPVRTTLLGERPQPPTGLAVTESLYLLNPAVVAGRATLSWTGSGARYEVRWTRTDGLTGSAVTDGASIDIAPVEPGIYDFSVVAVDALGRRSAPATIRREIYGITAAPQDVTGFTVRPLSGMAFAAWDRATDLDVLVGGDIEIRWSPLISGAIWDAAVVLPDGAHNGGASNAVVSLAQGTYFAKFVDSGGHYSANAASFVMTEAILTGFQTVAASVQHPAFAGQMSGIYRDGGAIRLANATAIDDYGDIDDQQDIDTVGGIVSSGEYAFDAVLDLGTSAARRFQAHVQALSYDAANMIDARTQPVDDWLNVHGDINDCSATVFASMSDDGAVWGPWTPFITADFAGRYARFKAALTSGDQQHNIAVSELSVAAKIPA